MRQNAITSSHHHDHHPQHHRWNNPLLLYNAHWMDDVKSDVNKKTRPTTGNNVLHHAHMHSGVYASKPSLSLSLCQWGDLLYKANPAQFIQCTFRCFNLDICCSYRPNRGIGNRLEWVLNCADLIKHFSNGLCWWSAKCGRERSWKVCWCSGSVHFAFRRRYSARPVF